MGYSGGGGGGSATLNFVDVGAWTAFGSYAVGNFRTEPNGDRRVVNIAYQAGATYGAVDGAPNTSLVTPATVSLATGDARWQAIGTGYKEVAAWTGDDLFVGYDADFNGVDMVSAGAVHALIGEMELPPEGASLLCDIWQMPVATGIDAKVATITIAAGSVYGALNPLGADLTFADGDKFTARISQVGSTYTGRGLKIRMALNGRSFPAQPATPGVPTGLAITSTTANSVTCSWTQGTGSNQVILYRQLNGGTTVPYITLSGVTSFTDFGPLGTGLNAGDTVVYSLRARKYSATSALTGTVSGTALLAYSWLPNVGGAGNIDPTMVKSMVGSSLSQAVNDQVVGSAPQLITMIGGNSGNNALADRVANKHIKDLATHTGYNVDFEFQFNNQSTNHEVYIRSDDFDVTSISTLNFYQFSMNVTGMKFGLKSAGWAVTAGTDGTGAQGSFQAVSASAYPVNLMGSITRTANGIINFPTGTPVANSTLIGLRFEVAPKAANGTQTIVVKQGTQTQFETSPLTMPVWMTIVIPAPVVTGMPTTGGFCFVQQLGTPTAASTPVFSTSIKQFTVTPTTGANV